MRAASLLVQAREKHSWRNGKCRQGRTRKSSAAGAAVARRRRHSRRPAPTHKVRARRAHKGRRALPGEALGPDDVGCENRPGGKRSAAVGHRMQKDRAQKFGPERAFSSRVRPRQKPPRHRASRRLRTKYPAKSPRPGRMRAAIARTGTRTASWGERRAIASAATAKVSQ